MPDSRVRSLRARLRAPPVMGGLLPVRRSQVAADVLAGITLAAVSIPVSLGYAKIAGMPVVTGLYTLLLPMAVFAIFGSSRHLVVGADSATAAILGAALAGLGGCRLAAIRPAGRAGGPARGRAAAAGPAGPARVPGEFPVPDRPDRVPHRRRYPGRCRAAPRHARGHCHRQEHPGQAPGGGAGAAAGTRGRCGGVGRGHRDRAGCPGGSTAGSRAC